MCQGVQRRVAIFLSQGPSPPIKNAVSDGLIIFISTGNREQSPSFPQVVGATFDAHMSVSHQKGGSFFFFFTAMREPGATEATSGPAQ